MSFSKWSKRSRTFVRFHRHCLVSILNQPVKQLHNCIQKHTSTWFLCIFLMNQSANTWVRCKTFSWLWIILANFTKIWWSHPKLRNLLNSMPAFSSKPSGTYFHFMGTMGWLRCSKSGLKPVPRRWKQNMQNIHSNCTLFRCSIFLIMIICVYNLAALGGMMQNEKEVACLQLEEYVASICQLASV